MSNIVNNSCDLPRKEKINISHLYSQFGVFIILLVAMAAATLMSDSFLSARNLVNILRQNAVITIIACGAQVVLICGEVDLSPGSVAAFGGCIATMVMASTHSLILAVAAGLGIGMIIGLINGTVITFFKIPSFIMTLATMQAARGALLAVTKAQPISGVDNFSWLGQGYVGPIPIPIIILVFILTITWFIMNKLRFGRYMYAVGGNSSAAKASGINVSSIKTRAFMYQGIMAGLGGTILMSRLDSGQPTGALGYEFDAITAVIIGGTSMSGGIGNIYGTIAGAMFVAVLVNIMTLTNVSAYYQQIVQGLIIAIAVIIDVRVRASKKI